MQLQFSKKKLLLINILNHFILQHSIADIDLVLDTSLILFQIFVALKTQYNARYIEKQNVFLISSN